MKNKQIPLIVDLDGTIIKTDLFFESAIVFVVQNFFNFFKMFYWWWGTDRTHLKLKVSQQVDLDISSMPYNEEVVHWLKNEYSKGRSLILVTGAYQKHAEQVASYLGIFKKVYGVSEKRRHLTGKNKTHFLVSLFGEKNFDYMGNSFIDFKV